MASWLTLGRGRPYWRVRSTRVVWCCYHTEACRQVIVFNEAGISRSAIINCISAKCGKIRVADFYSSSLLRSRVFVSRFGCLCCSLTQRLSSSSSTKIIGFFVAEGRLSSWLREYDSRHTNDLVSTNLLKFDFSIRAHNGHNLAKPSHEASISNSQDKIFDNSVIIDSISLAFAVGFGDDLFCLQISVGFLPPPEHLLSDQLNGTSAICING